MDAKRRRDLGAKVVKALEKIGATFLKKIEKPDRRQRPQTNCVFKIDRESFSL